MRLNIVTGFFLPVPPLRGGATEKIWHRLALAFAAAGHSVAFFSRAWPGLPREETVAGVTHRRLPGADHTRFLVLNLALDFFWGLRVGRALPPGDAVICNTVTLPLWLPRFKPAAGRVAVVLGRIPKGQIAFYGRVARFYATSSAVAERAAAAVSSARARTRVIWNPIDWNLHAQNASRSGRPLIIGFVGRVHPEKGVGLLLAAAARLARRSDLPPWQLVITGPVSVREGGGGESWRDRLAAKFSPELGSRLQFNPPEYDAGRLARRYGAIDVFCYPSLAEKGETFGVAVAEAMAAGCAPVVSALACFEELVRDGETGLVFDHAPAGADARLAEALARLLTDAGLRDALARRAQAFVRRFDYSAVARNILGDLAELSA